MGSGSGKKPKITGNGSTDQGESHDIEESSEELSQNEELESSKDSESSS